MKRFLTLFILLAAVATMMAVRSKVIDEKNEFGGVTVKTTYSTGMRYHTEENVRETVEFFDADSVVVKVRKFMLNGKMGYEYYDGGVLQRIEWERPQGTIESVEHFSPAGVIMQVEWLNEDDTTHVDQTVFMDGQGEVERIERTPADKPRTIEHYEGDHVVRLDIYDECDWLAYTHHFDDRGHLRRREMFKPDGRLEKEFIYNEKEDLEREVWYLRTGKKTVDHYERGRKAKTEFFDRHNRLEKICYFNKDGEMTICEKYDDTGALTGTEEYNTD